MHEFMTRKQSAAEIKHGLETSFSRQNINLIQKKSKQFDEIRNDELERANEALGVNQKVVKNLEISEK